MKKTIMLLFVSLMAMMAWSCKDDDDKDVPMSYDMLPKPAQEFISTYFPSDKAVKVVRDDEHAGTVYEVLLATGNEIEFDAAGQWVDVSAPPQNSVPQGIVPTPIWLYVEANFPAYYINEITRNAPGYEIELTNGLELQFDQDGIFIGHLD